MRKAAAIIAAMLIIVVTAVSVTASALQNAWLVERHVNAISNFSPTVYASLDDAPTTGASVATMKKFEKIINSSGAEINHWEGTHGSTSGVYGTVTYGWQSSGGDNEDVYWIITTYTITLSKDSGAAQASTYYSAIVDGVTEIDAVTGSFNLGVATMSMTATLYRATSPYVGGNAMSTTLNVNYVSGTYAGDGMFWPVIKPQYYTNNEQALVALQGIQSTLNDLHDGLLGEYSDAELDGITSAVGDLDDTANSIGGALDVSDFDVVNPDIADGTEGIPVLFAVYSILFDNSWLVYIVSLALGMYVLKLVLYGKA